MDLRVFWRIMGLVAALLSSHFAIAQYDNLVKDRYVVFFKEPKPGKAPIVIKADREANLRRETPVPFGQHSTGQDIGELERFLNLNGKILNILDAMNAISVEVPPEEAERLRTHPDVLFVEAVRIAYAGSSDIERVWSLNKPNAESKNSELKLNGTYTLEVPSVDFLDNPGLYQDVVFERRQSDDSWILRSVNVGFPINRLETVEVIKTSEVPVQVFLKISGNISPCLDVGMYAAKTIGNFFEVSLYYDPESIPPSGKVCADSVDPFTKTIPLQVYGLGAGEYTFSVNGKKPGSFVLLQDNVLPY